MTRRKRGLRGSPADHERVAEAYLKSAEETLRHEGVTCGQLLVGFGKTQTVRSEVGWTGGAPNVIGRGDLAERGQKLADQYIRRIHDECFCKPKRKR